MHLPSPPFVSTLFRSLRSYNRLLRAVIATMPIICRGLLCGETLADIESQVEE